MAKANWQQLLSRSPGFYNKAPFGTITKCRKQNCNLFRTIQNT